MKVKHTESVLCDAYRIRHRLRGIFELIFSSVQGEQPDPPFDDSTEDDEIEDPSDPVPDLGNVQINTQPTTYVPEPQQPTHYQPPQQPTQSYQPEPYQQEKIKNSYIQFIYNMNYIMSHYSKSPKASSCTSIVRICSLIG